MTPALLAPPDRLRRRAAATATLLLALAASCSAKPTGEVAPSQLGRPSASAPDAEAAEAAISEPARSVVTIGWGDADDAVGQLLQEEGEAEGPATALALADGSLLVVDQVNGRLQKRAPDGTFASVPLPTPTVQDVAVMSDGTVLVLDPYQAAAVIALDPDGNELTRLPLAGLGVEEATLVTSLHLLADGVWISVADEAWVRLADASLSAVPERVVLPGLPTPDGEFLLVTRFHPTTGVALLLARRDEGEPIVIAQPRFERGEVVGRSLLDVDPSGTVYLGVVVRAGESLEDHLLVLDPVGTELAHVRVARSSLPHAAFRTARLGDDGTVTFLRATETGLEIEQVQP